MAVLQPQVLIASFPPLNMIFWFKPFSERIVFHVIRELEHQELESGHDQMVKLGIWD